MSREAVREIRSEIRGWRLSQRVSRTLEDLARSINPVVRGWINYYGFFYKSLLFKQLNAINEHLARWAMQKYKRIGRRKRAAWRFLAAVATREPNLFAHWRTRPIPGGRVMGAG